MTNLITTQQQSDGEDFESCGFVVTNVLCVHACSWDVYIFVELTAQQNATTKIESKSILENCYFF